MTPSSTAARYRFEMIEATLNWAHTEVAVELGLISGPGDRVEVELTVLAYGSYPENRPEPPTAKLRLTGVAVKHDNDISINVDQPAPLRTITFATDVPLVEWLCVGRESKVLFPDFWEPLLEWARGQGLDARTLWFMRPRAG